MNHATSPVGAPAGTFTQLLSSTRRGARLARLLAVTELRSRGASQDLTERAELVVAELAANAVLHGRVPGRCFRLTLALDPAADRLRVEVTDARGDLWPWPAPAEDGPGALPSADAAWHSSPPSPTTGTASPTRPAARPSGRC